MGKQKVLLIQGENSKQMDHPMAKRSAEEKIKCSSQEKRNGALEKIIVKVKTVKGFTLYWGKDSILCPVNCRLLGNRL
jgi:hypothetical protein